MFAISLELLSGRYIATEYNDRDRAEWPPHPARLFSALVATWADGGPESHDAGLAALRWLETLPPPVILACDEPEVARRTTATVFVPVNDVQVVTPPSRDKLDEAEADLAAAVDKAHARAAAKVAKLRDKLAADTAKAVAVPTTFGKGDPAKGAAAVEQRTRQPRTFPSVTPAIPAVVFEWADHELPGEHATALAGLLRCLVRVGHSSSFVRAGLGVGDTADVSALDRFVVDEREGDRSIRWVGPGQVDRLRQMFDRHRETEPRLLPSRSVRYRVASAGARSPIARSVFEDQFIVLGVTAGPRLPSHATAGVTRQLRRALMASADQPVHAMISGHEPGGAPSPRPHLAIAALPLVIGPHPDGSILGLALILPRDCPDEARAAVMRAIGRLEVRASERALADGEIVLHLGGGVGDLTLRQGVWNALPQKTLAPETWCRSSRRWATATPIALDRNPGNLHDEDPARRREAFATAQELVASAVRNIGLPPPSEIDVLRSCVLPGTTKPHRFPPFPADRDRPQRVLVHARLVFERPVAGPLLLGAGRYHGLGLCLPVDPPQMEARRG